MPRNDKMSLAKLQQITKETNEKKTALLDLLSKYPKGRVPQDELDSRNLTMNMVRRARTKKNKGLEIVQPQGRPRVFSLEAINNVRLTPREGDATHSMINETLQRALMQDSKATECIELKPEPFIASKSTLKRAFFMSMEKQNNTDTQQVLRRKTTDRICLVADCARREENSPSVLKWIGCQYCDAFWACGECHQKNIDICEYIAYHEKFSHSTNQKQMKLTR